MKQVIQNTRSGKLSVKDVPEPRVRAGHLLVRTSASLISAGTERLVVGFAKKSLAAKAKARPDLVRKVMNKARRDGKALWSRLAPSNLVYLPVGWTALCVSIQKNTQPLAQVAWFPCPRNEALREMSLSPTVQLVRGIRLNGLSKYWVPLLPFAEVLENLAQQRAPVAQKAAPATLAVGSAGRPSDLPALPPP